MKKSRNQGGFLFQGDAISQERESPLWNLKPEWRGVLKEIVSPTNRATENPEVIEKEPMRKRRGLFDKGGGTLFNGPPVKGSPPAQGNKAFHP